MDTVYFIIYRFVQIPHFGIWNVRSGRTLEEERSGLETNIDQNKPTWYTFDTSVEAQPYLHIVVSRLTTHAQNFFTLKYS